MTVFNPTNVVTFTGDGVATEFPFTFLIPEDALVVSVLDLASSIEIEVAPELYSVTGLGDDDGGEVTYPLSGSPLGLGFRLNIKRRVPYEQGLALTNQSPFFPRLLESQLDQLVMQTQQLSEEVSRAVRIPTGSDADELNDLVGSIIALSALQNDIETIVDIASSITAVETIATEIVIVAGIAAAVTSVAGIQASVTAVATIDASVVTVAGIAAAVSAVAAIDDAVNAVAVIDTEVVTVSGITANIGTVAGIAADVTAVAAVAADVDTVAGIAANVTSVAGNATNINTVAGDSTEINTVAGIAAAISTVAGDAVDIATVANVSTDVTAVAAVSSEVIAVAAVDTAVSAVAAIDDDVQTVAANVVAVTNYASTYLGGKTADPTLRNDGSALQIGDLYFNTTDSVMKVRGASAWLAAYASLGEALQTNNNLSDVASVSAARTNLGLVIGTDIAAFSDTRITGAIQSSLLTTRGDMIARGASAPQRLGLGANGTIVASDGTDALYRTLTALMDVAFGNTRGMILRRGASVWEALPKGATGQVLTQGANDPSWAAAPASGWDMTGQTWQDVSASRALSTSYQNTTGKPIMVAMWRGANSTAEVSVDNSTWISVYGSGDGGAQFIVPPNWYYKCGAFTGWAELR